jgi:hypothetical protein
MRDRALSNGLLCGLVAVCLSGCQQAKDPQGGPLNAGPYPECRSLVEWIRIKTNDPEAHVTRWGSRQEQHEEGVAKENTPVVIEVHYTASIGKVENGQWSQTFRVTGRRIQEDTPPSAE